jgi:ribulose-bisphosphate carboxylase large chain
MNLFRQTVNLDSHIIATYDMSSQTNLRDAAWDLAIGQSVGNPNVRNKWENDELFENHSCKICHTEEELRVLQSGIVKIAFPIANTDWVEDGVTHLLVQLMGGQLDIDRITRCRLIDICFPKNVLKYFKGPKYGMSGVREFTEVYNKPLLGAIIKPKIGITPEILLEMVKQLVEGGVNFIKEDEIMANPSICPIEVRVPLISKYLKDKKVIYAVCINGDAPYVLERAKRVYELGGNAIHVNFWAGLGIYRSLRDLDLPLFIHFQKSGDKILTDRSHRFGIDWPVICDLAGLSGVDTIHAGMIGGYSNSDDKEMKKVMEVLEKRNVVPALSCGMHPGLVEYIRSQVGDNFMANCGGSIHGHSDGTVAGATAMRQAIDRVDGTEYKSAISKWGLRHPPPYVIIPMAGNGSRFVNFGFKTPKFLLPINSETTMIEAAVKTLNASDDTTYSFVALKDTSEKLCNLLSQFNPIWTLLDKVSEGPATSALHGLPDNQDTPIIVSNSDQILHNWNCSEFIEKCKGYDGGVLTYTPPYTTRIGETDKHSYVEIVNDKCVKFAEKIVLSEHALVGVNYFRNACVFREAYKSMVARNERAPNGEFYLSLMYNSILSNGGTVCHIPMKDNEQFYPTGEPEDYFHYLNTVSKFGPKTFIGEHICNLSNLKVFVTHNAPTIRKDMIFVSLDGPNTGKITNTVVDSGKTLVIQSQLFNDLHIIPTTHIENMLRGWFIGDFEPSILRTNKFEVGLLTHKAGEKWPYHIHDHVTEYNYIVSGKMIINDKYYFTDDMFMFEPGHPAVPIFLEDCVVVCIKTPSIPSDKRII